MEVRAGQVNFRGSLPCSANNVLQPMLHPDHCHIIHYSCDELLYYDSDRLSWVQDKVVRDRVVSNQITYFCRFEAI